MSHASSLFDILIWDLLCLFFVLYFYCCLVPSTCLVSNVNPFWKRWGHGCCQSQYLTLKNSLLRVQIFLVVCISRCTPLCARIMICCIFYSSRASRFQWGGYWKASPSPHHHWFLWFQPKEGVENHTFRSESMTLIRRSHVKGHLLKKHLPLFLSSSLIIIFNHKWRNSLTTTVEDT